MSLFLPFLVGGLVGLTAALAAAALTRRRRRTRWEIDQAIRRHPAGRAR